LNIAADHANIKIVRLLLQSGADVTAAEHNGWTALHWASGRSRKDVVQLLLEYKADIMAVDDGGNLP